MHPSFYLLFSHSRSSDVSWQCSQPTPKPIWRLMLRSIRHNRRQIRWMSVPKRWAESFQERKTGCHPFYDNLFCFIWDSVRLVEKRKPDRPVQWIAKVGQLEIWWYLRYSTWSEYVLHRTRYWSLPLFGGALHDCSVWAAIEVWSVEKGWWSVMRIQSDVLPPLSAECTTNPQNALTIICVFLLQLVSIYLNACSP